MTATTADRDEPEESNAFRTMSSNLAAAITNMARKRSRANHVPASADTRPDTDPGRDLANAPAQAARIIVRTKAKITPTQATPLRAASLSTGVFRRPMNRKK